MIVIKAIAEWYLTFAAIDAGWWWFYNRRGGRQGPRWRPLGWPGRWH